MIGSAELIKLGDALCGKGQSHFSAGGGSCAAASAWFTKPEE